MPPPRPTQLVPIWRAPAKKGKGPPDVQTTGFLPGAPSGEAGGEEDPSAEGAAGSGMGPGHAGMDHNGVRPRVRGGQQRPTDWMGYGQPHPVPVSNLNSTLYIILVGLPVLTTGTGIAHGPGAETPTINT